MYRKYIKLMNKYILVGPWDHSDILALRVMDKFAITMNQGPLNYTNTGVIVTRGMEPEIRWGAPSRELWSILLLE